MLISCVIALFAGEAPASAGMRPPPAPHKAVKLAPFARPNCAPGEVVRGVNVGTEKLVTFTFDDGPHADTRKVMDLFAQHKITATFFDVGANVDGNSEIAKETVARGFEIANHSQTHRYRPSTIASEVAVADRTIERVTGKRPRFFRPPGLTMSDSILDAARDEGLCVIMTTAILGDHLMPRLDSWTLCARFSANLHPGAIVLLHEAGGHRQTVNALPCMLDAAQRKGYRVVSLYDLLAAGTPYSGPRPRASGDSEPLAGEVDGSIAAE